MNPIFLIGPFVAAVGLVAVFFVMRHKSVQTRSMYSSRRSNLERKVRAARTRTLGPEKHVDKDAAAPHTITSAKVAYERSAFEGPPVAPPAAPGRAQLEAPNQSWDVGPTVPPPSTPTVAPPPAPPYTPEPPAPPPKPVWTPGPPEPATAAQPSPPARVEVPAAAGASWSIVGAESKDDAITPPDGKKKKKSKGDATRSAWELASGDESEGEVKKSSSALAIAQYAVLVVGLVMVLIGVLVMVANSHVT